MVSPPRIAEVQRTRIRQRSSGCAGNAADHGARSGVPGKGADAAPAPAPMRPPDTARSPGVVPHALSANAAVITAVAAKVFIIDMFLSLFGVRALNGRARKSFPLFPLRNNR